MEEKPILIFLRFSLVIRMNVSSTVKNFQMCFLNLIHPSLVDTLQMKKLENVISFGKKYASVAQWNRAKDFYGRVPERTSNA